MCKNKLQDRNQFAYLGLRGGSPSSFGFAQRNKVGRGRRLLVDAFNAVQVMGNIVALGYLGLQTTDAKFPNGHPQVVQVAIQGGENIPENLSLLQDGKEVKPFIYNYKSSMAIISKYKAIVDLPLFSFTGFFAWLVWLFIHITPLVGFRNNVKLACSWLWSFITNYPPCG